MKHEYKIGDIGVRINHAHGNHAIGRIYKAERKPYSKGSFPYNNHSSMSSAHVRPATQIEIEAYNNGIRNINDIPKTVELNYEIY
jgi:hypothetical protein